MACTIYILTAQSLQVAENALLTARNVSDIRVNVEYASEDNTTWKGGTLILVTLTAKINTIEPYFTTRDYSTSVLVSVENKRSSSGSGAENQQVLWDFLEDLGWTDYAIAGVVAYCVAENGCRSNILEYGHYTDSSMSHQVTSEEYTAMSDGAGGVSYFADQQFYYSGTGRFRVPGYGMFSFTSSRYKRELFNLCQEMGVSVSDAEAQITYWYQSVERQKPWLIEDLNAATSAVDAAMIMTIQYGLGCSRGTSVASARSRYPLAFGSSYERRVAAANEVYAQFAG